MDQAFPARVSRENTLDGKNVPRGWQERKPETYNVRYLVSGTALPRQWQNVTTRLWCLFESPAVGFLKTTRAAPQEDARLRECLPVGAARPVSSPGVA